jgi:hypothetical protein
VPGDRGRELSHAEQAAQAAQAVYGCGYIQAEEFLPRSDVIVAPTSRSAHPASFRPEAEIAGETTRVLLEQI